MTGPTWAPIVIPIVVMIALAGWLAMAYYAEAHPGWKAHRAATQPDITRTTAHADTRTQIVRRDARPWRDATRTRLVLMQAVDERLRQHPGEPHKPGAVARRPYLPPDAATGWQPPPGQVPVGSWRGGGEADRPGVHAR
jgi:hypothetical protein